MATKNSKAASKKDSKSLDNSYEAVAIRAAFSAAGGDSHTVWVTSRIRSTPILGYVEAIEGDLVVVGVEGQGHFDRKIKTLVLYRHPTQAKKKSKAETNQDQVKAFAFPTRKSMKALKAEEKATESEVEQNQEQEDKYEIELAPPANDKDKYETLVQPEEHRVRVRFDTLPLLAQFQDADKYYTYLKVGNSTAIHIQITAACSERNGPTLTAFEVGEDGKQRFKKSEMVFQIRK
jgi:hypothetical protein